MKWYHSLLIACGIALVSPQIASAKPIPAASVNNYGIAGAKPAPTPVARPAAPAPAAKPAPAPAAKPAPAPAAKPAPMAPPNMAARPPVPPKPAHIAPPPAPKPAHIAPPPAPKPAHVMGMNSRDFRRLIDSIDRERTASKKLRKARKALDSRLTSAQVRDILSHLTYDSDRVSFACDAYHNVVDRKNWSVIQSALSFASSRRNVMECTR